MPRSTDAVVAPAAAVTASHRRERFATGISRRLTLFVALLILGGLAVGGASVALAFRIVGNHDAVVREYDHVLKIDGFHAAFHDLIFELHQMDSTGGHERAVEARVIQDDLVRSLEGLAGMHAAEQDSSEAELEKALLAELRTLTQGARTSPTRSRTAGI